MAYDDLMQEITFLNTEMHISNSVEIEKEITCSKVLRQTLNDLTITSG